MRAHLVHVVLESAGHARKDTQRLAGSNSIVDCLGLLEGEFVGHLQEGVDRGVLIPDSVQACLCKLRSGELFGNESLVDGLDTECFEVAH